MKRRIYVFFGMIASGKSLLGQSFAEAHNFTYYNTDRVRKELAGLEPSSNCGDDLNQGIYSQEFTLRTYGTLLDRSREKFLEAAAGVVLDGSYSSRLERGRVRELAAELKLEPVFILCSCSDGEVKQRLATRARDPKAVSDGDWTIYQAQKESFEPPDELADTELIVMDTEAEVQQLRDQLDAALFE